MAVRIGPVGAKSASAALLQAPPPLLHPPGEKCGLGPTGLLRGALIDLSVDGDIVVLQLFGTGLRGAPAGSVSVTIGGAPATTLYAGPQNQFPGLDQINNEVPRSLAGRGVVPVAVAVDGVRISPVLIRIR